MDMQIQINQKWVLAIKTRCAHRHGEMVLVPVFSNFPMVVKQPHINMQSEVLGVGD
jgi:hypothetical protein